MTEPANAQATQVAVGNQLADDFAPDLPLVLVDRTVTEFDDEGHVRERSVVQVPVKTGNRFKPGAEWAGNAKGRSKGTKNRITIQRLLTEEHLRNRLGVNAEDLLEKAVLMAMAGNEKLMGLLLDKLLATPKNDEGDAGKDTSITVTINDHASLKNLPVATVESGRVRLFSTEQPIDGDIS